MGPKNIYINESVSDPASKKCPLGLNQSLVFM